MEVAGEGMGAGGTGGVPPPPPLVVEVEEAAEKAAVCGVTCSGIFSTNRGVARCIYRGKNLTVCTHNPAYGSNHLYITSVLVEPK